MDKRERELFRKAKEQKRLLREQKRKERDVQETTKEEKSINRKEGEEENNSSKLLIQKTGNQFEMTKSEIINEIQSNNEKLFLNIKKNYDEESQNNNNNAKHVDERIYKNCQNEPEAPLHRNKKQNVNQYFTDYVEEQMEENKRRKNFKEQGNFEETDSRRSDILEESMNEEAEEVIEESYEIMDDIFENTDQDYIEFMEKLKNKSNLYKRNHSEIKTEEQDSTVKKNMDKTHKEEESILHIMDNELKEFHFYNPVESAQYEELDYLHKILIEKKKELLGDSYDEEKERQEEELLDVLDDIHEFHKRKSRYTICEPDEECKSEFRIEDIYAFLHMERDKSLRKDNSEPKEKNNSPTNGNENIPKGFFDDQEKDILVRNKISLSSLNHNIAMIKKEKKKILSMYASIDNLENSRVSKFIDFLYDDNDYKKDEIMKDIETIKNKRKESVSTASKDSLNTSFEACEPKNKKKKIGRSAEKNRIELLKKKFFEKTGSEYVPEWMKPPVWK